MNKRSIVFVKGLLGLLLLGLLFFGAFWLDRDGRARTDERFKETFGIEQPRSDKEWRAASSSICLKLEQLDKNLLEKRAERNKLREELALTQLFQRQPNVVLKKKLDSTITETAKALNDLKDACSMAANTILPDGSPLGETPPCNEGY